MKITGQKKNNFYPSPYNELLMEPKRGKKNKQETKQNGKNIKYKMLSINQAFTHAQGHSHRQTSCSYVQNLQSSIN